MSHAPATGSDQGSQGGPRGASRIVRKGLLLLSLFLHAGGCDSSTGPDQNTIGIGGGDVTLAGGAVTLSVPPDALSGEVAFTAVPSTSFPPSDLLVPGSTYDVGPAQTTFARLARLTLRYDPQSLPEGVRETELRLYRATGNAWQMAVNASVDTDGRTVFGTVSSLGQFAARGVSVDAVQVTPSFFMVEVGQTKGLIGVGLDASGISLPDRSITWTSSDETVATVDDEGVVTAVGVGWAAIQATAEGVSVSTQVHTWSCSGQARVSAAECEAVVDLYFTLEDDWRLEPYWVTGPDPCGWRGVVCSQEGIEELSLSSSDLQGPIPNSIGDLTYLRSLSLSGEYSGAIPAALGNLTELVNLSLYSNQLSGAIPSELQALTKLEVLNLALNELDGPLPSWLGTLTNLRELRVGWNEMTGPIPPELGQLSNLTIFHALDNHLSGSIPPELGGLTALNRLSVSLNELSGQIPPELGNLTELTSLGLGPNQLSGPIPVEIGNLTKLIGLYLGDCALSGVVPLAVAQLGGQIQARSGGATECRFTPGNTGLSIPDTQDYRDADLNGDGLICGLSIGGPTTSPFMGGGLP